ncbi:MAG: fused MFS/spermidine synthase, partial [Chloroflexi bacterium]|nr:fused MFS/spermidine synthase [Chloroflexota bacterium]
RLYALSNVGSLLGLVTYPFLVEPVLALKTQAYSWACGYVVFAVCAVYGALRTMRLNAAPTGRAVISKARSPVREEARPGVGVRIFWVALSACASVVLLATTNQISQEIPAGPFLWVLPLALYMLSFILCFSSKRWYFRTAYTAAFFIGTLTFCWVFYGGGTLLAQIGVYSLVLFICCMICHGELARLKPHPRYLTQFYLLVSAGGVLGGIAVNLVAPRVFTDFLELPVGLLGCWGLLLIVFAGDWRSDRNRWASRLTDTLLMGGIGMLGVVLFLSINRSSVNVLNASRNFYGVLRVRETNLDEPHQHAYELAHGATLQGFQYLDEEKRRLPTAYYTEESGAGLALLHHPQRDAGLRIGVVGLGVGTLATYGRPGDTIRFYEINPEVIRLAEGQGGYFTYLEECPAQVEIVLGDARISMERELAAGDSQQFDLLVVDAFLGDAVPVHLLTKEAFDTYLRHLQPDGVMALHISSYWMDLRPVVQELADYFHLGTALINSGGDGERVFGSDWMLVTRSEEFLEQPEIAGRSSPRQSCAGFRLWTDDYSSVFQTLKRGQSSGGLLEGFESP